MRGSDHRTDHLFSYFSPEARVPADHPLRPIRRMTDDALGTMSREFERVYSDFGRPSIPPEQLLRALLLQVLYTIRSERLLMEQLAYNLLFRWFVGLGLDEPVWDHSTFSKNRDRLLDGDLASAFFRAVRAQADAAHLLSDEHFTVDGTLLEAWASHKSLRPREDTVPRDDGGGSNPTVDFRGERRSNATHRSTTDPDARLYRKADGAAAKLAYLGHLVTENRHGLIIDTEVTVATGFGERDAAIAMLRDVKRKATRTVGGDKNFDARAFIAGVRGLGFTPHVAQFGDSVRRRSGVDRRTTRHHGYARSQEKRKLVEEAFGWLKTVGGLRKLHHRGVARVRWVFTFGAAAYNLTRMRTLFATA
jgi:transposase